MKFIVGDRVRVIRGYHGVLDAGRIVTVNVVVESGQDTYGETQGVIVSPHKVDGPGGEYDVTWPYVWDETRFRLIDRRRDVRSVGKSDR